MSIRVLPKDVVDKIAAGEVIERPASVVKELVENSLDAGAKRISIEVEDGGSRLIKVVDDGAGFDAADLALAFESHATSKLSEVDDLLHIGSFGFRGEALASIGSVSRARIRSLKQGAATGAQIDCDGGRLSAVRDLGVPPGTTIEVRDLFFNVPARRRFLRAKATELAHIVDTLTRFSLSHPEVAFTLRHEGKEVLSAPPATTLVERIAHAHGAKFAQTLIHAEGRASGLHLEAFLAPPDQARRRVQWQYLFVNGRTIRDRTLGGAMRRAYAEVLPEVLQPVYFLFLEMDPEQVDVNVHPTKAEVRFRDGSAIFRLVHHAVTGALQRSDLAPRVAVAGMPDAWPLRTDAASTSVASDRWLAPPAVGSGASLVREGERESLTPRPLARPGFLPLTSPASDPMRARSIATPTRYLQIHRTYIGIEVSEGLMLIDQHALHERVLYQRLRQSFKGGRLERQRFLVPYVVELDRVRVTAIEDAQELLERVSVELRPVGERAVALSAAPTILSPLKPQALVDAIVSRLLDERPDGRDDDFLDRTLFTMACHRAVRAGDELSQDEIEALLGSADLEEHTHTCPHGRPTRIVVTTAELESLFKRRGF